MNIKDTMARAKRELRLADYLSKCGKNEGIRAIYSDKAEMLRVLIRLAEMAGEMK